jgi:adenosine deaminase
MTEAPDTEAHDTEAAREWIRRLPKAEIHVHLEGCIAPEIVTAAARGTEPRTRPDVADLGAFLEYLDWSCALIDSSELVERVAYDAAERFAESGTRYVDMIFNPTHWSAWEQRLDEFVGALDRGFAFAELEGNPPVALCVSVGRHQSAAEAGALVDWAGTTTSPRLVGVSIDGDEATVGRTSPRFAEAFADAASRGLRRAVHAGESSGPEGVRDALDLLGAERIDHGVRAVEDPALVRELAGRGVALAVAPTSNLALGLVREIGDHPIEALRGAGVRVCINTDDPLLFGCDLVSEYDRCARAFQWDRTVLVHLARTSITASFAPAALVAQLLADLDAYSATAEDDYNQLRRRNKR